MSQRTGHAVVAGVTWPPYKGGSWELANKPAWWQFGWLNAIGVALSALPSLAVSLLDGLFASTEYLRYPFAGSLIALEVLVLCVATYRIVARSPDRGGWS